MRFSAKSFTSILLTAAMLSGCASIPALDPAAGVPANAGPPLTFSSLSDATSQLAALSKDYAGKRDDMQRAQAWFDVFVIGIPFAAAANGIFHGAKDATVALGLAAVGASGVKSYFGPQIKVTAYNNAASSLACASSVASELNGLQVQGKDWDPNGGAKMAELLVDLGRANDEVNSNSKNFQSLSNDQRKAFTDARDAAVKANADVTTAFAVLNTAPSQLATFASTVIQSTTDKIVTGVQNVDAILKSIASAAPSSSTPATKPTTSAAVAAGAPNPDISLISTLQSNAMAGEAAAKLINDKWATLTSCALPKS